MTALGLLAIAFNAHIAWAEETFSVSAREIADPKAVFATIQSSNVVPARARNGGTVASLNVGYGARVDQEQVIATIADEKLVTEIKLLDAQIDAAQAQLAQAQMDLARVEKLAATGAESRQHLDLARTALKVADNTLKAKTSERGVAEERLREGEVLAPTTGRVLTVPVTVGTVVMPGDPIAQVAEGGFVLRLRVPERHARFMKVGDPVRLDAAPGTAEDPIGRITLVYPEIQDGRVVADAQAEGLGDYFVGERVRVWIDSGKRSAFIVPASFVATRFGIDYIRVRQTKDTVIDVPVQRGRPLPLPGLADGLELLSGVQAGDVLVSP
jgi:RND family efflux transporter MFP subunit